MKLFAHISRSWTDSLLPFGVFPRTGKEDLSPCHPKVMRYIKRQGTTRLRGVRNGDHGPIAGGMTDDDRLGHISAKSLAGNMIGDIKTKKVCV